VNLDGVLANVASITVILAAFAAVIVKSIKRSIKDEIEKVVAEKVTPVLVRIQSRLDEHDTRLARLEGVEEGKKQAIAQAGVSTGFQP
jgi:predicted nucleic acid-binding protein